MSKQPSIATLHKRLTTVFNLYIRLRDTLPDADGKRFGKCISCGVLKPMSELDAGHFIGSNVYAHKYTESNINIQCWKCNRFEHGNLIGYFLGIEAKYGKGTAEFLWNTRLTKVEWTRERLQDMIDTYSLKVKEIME